MIYFLTPHSHGVAGKLNDFEKVARIESSFVKYVKEKTDIPLITSLNTCEQLAYQLAENPLAVAYIGGTDTIQSLEYEKASKRDDVGRFSFMHTLNESCASNYPGLQTPGFVFGRGFDKENVLVYDGDAPQLVGWMKKNSYPKFGEMVSDFSEPFLKEGVPVMLLVSNIKTRDTYYHNVFKQAAEQL